MRGKFITQVPNQQEAWINVYPENQCGRTAYATRCNAIVIANAMRDAAHPPLYRLHVKLKEPASVQQ